MVDHQQYEVILECVRGTPIVKVYGDGLCCYAGLYLVAVAVGACSGRHLGLVQAVVEGFSAVPLRRLQHLEHRVRPISSC